MAFCFRCGSPVTPGAAFCSSCGAQQTASQPAPQPEPTPQPPVQPIQAAKKLSSLAKFLIAAGILLTVVAVAVFVFTDLGNLFKSDEDLIRERIQAYEDACNDGDYDAMLECMDEETQAMMEMTMGFMDGMFSEGTGMDFGMSDMFGMAGAMGDYCQIEIRDIDIDGDYATVTVEMYATMFGQTQSSGEAELPMVKDGLNWYIGGTEHMIGQEMPDFPWGY